MFCTDAQLDPLCHRMLVPQLDAGCATGQPIVKLFVQLHRWPYIAARLVNRTQGELPS